jgi:hypothetical protein
VLPDSVVLCTTILLKSIGKINPTSVGILVAGPPFILASVVKGPKFRPQNTKGAEKNYNGPGKSGAELQAELSKKGRKGAKLFL